MNYNNNTYYIYILLVVTFTTKTFVYVLRYLNLKIKEIST